MSTNAILTSLSNNLIGELSGGEFVVNDYVLTLTEGSNGYTLTIRKGSQVQTVTVTDPKSISSVTQVASSQESGGRNTLRVVLDDGTFTDFDFYNGQRGAQGDPGLSAAERQSILNAEALRVSAENTRAAAEVVRVNSENDRVLYETIRRSEEAERVQQENNRVSAEVTRANAEISRAVAENNRVISENERKAAETTRDNTWKSLRTSAEELISSMGSSIAGKVNKPSGDGTSGQLLSTNGDGTTAWVNPPTANNNATVEVDATLSTQGKAADAKAVGDALALKAAASDLAFLSIQDQATRSALISLLTQLVQLIPNLAFSSASHNGATVVSAANAAITAMGGSSGGGSDTYAVTNVLSHCSSSNNASSINNGSSYSATLTIDTDYVLDSVTITMGGTDITSTAWNSGTNTISIASVTGNVIILAYASQDESSEITYTENVLYNDFTATAQRFSTGDVTINFAAGDYIEAKIDATACTQDQENILAVGKNSTSYIESYDSAVAFLFYKRAQSGVDKILVRIKDVTENVNVSVDKWIVPNDMANVLIKIDKNGVYIDNTLVSGITSANIANLISLGTYIVGVRASKLTTAAYDYVTVYNLN